jgi:hypothetical protein
MRQGSVLPDKGVGVVDCEEVVERVELVEVMNVVGDEVADELMDEIDEFGLQSLTPRLLVGPLMKH